MAVSSYRHDLIHTGLTVRSKPPTDAFAVAQIGNPRYVVAASHAGFIRVHSWLKERFC